MCLDELDELDERDDQYDLHDLDRHLSEVWSVNVLYVA